jgi:hypothetical protein
VFPYIQLCKDQKKPSIRPIKRVIPNKIFKLNQKVVGIVLNKKLSTTGNQPPKNKMEENVLIKSIFAYSPKKKRAKVIAFGQP